MVDGVQVIHLRRFEDERGWFAELMRESGLPKPMTQTNLSFSRQGVIRGLHYHERGQDDLFVCLSGTARVVVLDRESGETFTADIGDDNPVAVFIPGHHAHGYEALTDVLFLYHVTREYDPTSPDEHRVPWTETQDLDAVLPQVDVVYQTRIQKERFPDEASYLAVKGIYRIDARAMSLLQKSAIVMHPLPRVDEIAQEIDSDPRAAYFRQARNGMYIRMALLDRVLS